jgi:hypothetical protein
MPRFFMALALVLAALPAAPASAADLPMSLSRPTRNDLTRNDLAPIATSAKNLSHIASKMIFLVLQRPVDKPCPFVIDCEVVIGSLLRPLAEEAFMLGFRAESIDSEIDAFDLFVPIPEEAQDLRANHFNKIAYLQHQLRGLLDQTQMVPNGGYYPFKSECEDFFPAYWRLMKQLVMYSDPLGEIGGHNVD